MTGAAYDATVSQDAIRGFWCCDRSDCSYREFPRERKQTPQVALEISSPTTFMVSTLVHMSVSLESRWHGSTIAWLLPACCPLNQLMHHALIHNISHTHLNYLHGGVFARRSCMAAMHP